MLAWLAKGQFTVTHAGEVFRSPICINDRFLQYSQHLYSSQVNYTSSDLNTYLDRVTFPTLDVNVSSGLEFDITLEAILMALSQKWHSIPTLKHHLTIEVLWWEYHDFGFTALGPGPLAIIEGKVNSQVNQNILQDNVRVVV